MDQLHLALSSLKFLRTNVGQIFETLGGGIRIEHGEEHGENKFLLELQDLLTSTNSHLRYEQNFRLILNQFSCFPIETYVFLCNL